MTNSIPFLANRTNGDGLASWKQFRRDQTLHRQFDPLTLIIFHSSFCWNFFIKNQMFTISPDRFIFDSHPILILMQSPIIPPSIDPLSENRCDFFTPQEKISYFCHIFFFNFHRFILFIRIRKIRITSRIQKLDIPDTSCHVSVIFLQAGKLRPGEVLEAKVRFVFAYNTKLTFPRSSTPPPALAVFLFIHVSHCPLYTPPPAPYWPLWVIFAPIHSHLRKTPPIDIRTATNDLHEYHPPQIIYPVINRETFFFYCHRYFILFILLQTTTKWNDQATTITNHWQG